MPYMYYNSIYKIFIYKDLKHRKDVILCFTIHFLLYLSLIHILAPGMGLNAYFAYTVVIGMGYTWQYALTAVFAEGIIFILLSLTNVREAIFNAIPMNLKSAVSVGIGLFIAFVGLQNAHIVVGGSTLLQLFSVDAYNKANGVEASFNNVGITVILALAGIIITGILVVKNIKGNILWGILITWGLGIICPVSYTHLCNFFTTTYIHFVIINCINHFFFYR